MPVRYSPSAVVGGTSDTGRVRKYCGEGGGDITVRQKSGPGAIEKTRRVWMLSTAPQLG